MKNIKNKATKMRDLQESIKNKINAIPIKKTTQTNESTPNVNEINISDLLVIKFEFDKDWFDKILETNVRILTVFYQQLFRIFEKHHGYITSYLTNEKALGLFAFNTETDINQIFEICSITNSYLKEWISVIKELNFLIPQFKMIIDVIYNVNMTKLPKNFFGINPLNTNDFINFYHDDWEVNHIKNEFTQNAFYINQNLVQRLKLPYQKLLQNFNENYSITSATTNLKDDFKW